jgi:ABC-type sugar transport system permease subunit
MFLTTFRGNNFSMGAAMAVCIFVIASVFIVPYVVYMARQKRL